MIPSMYHFGTRTTIRTGMIRLPRDTYTIMDGPHGDIATGLTINGTDLHMSIIGVRIIIMIITTQFIPSEPGIV
jgi:hypothetical protein